MDVILATLLMVMVFAGMPLVMAYIWCLTRFFKEVQKNEPGLWQEIGKPTLANMLCLPFINFRKFYAFLPALLERRSSGEYRYAGRAIILLLAGLSYFILLMIVTLALILSL
jgi:hypothetical protein